MVDLWLGVPRKRDVPPVAGPGQSAGVGDAGVVVAVCESLWSGAQAKTRQSALVTPSGLWCTSQSSPGARQPGRVHPPSRE